MNEQNVEKERATFGSGCFWGVEESFRSLNGVLETSVGYMGGTKKDPTYEDVCSDTTGHVEVVDLTFNPKVISYRTLLDHFFKLHDPTTPNRQGPDIGTQYRSVIFFHSLEQEKLAKEKIKSLTDSGIFKKPIVTGTIPAMPYYRAEEYHQKYLSKRGLGTCHI